MSADPFRDLNGTKRWVAWLNKERGGKLTKVPYAPDGRRAKADDPATWCTRGEAIAASRRLANGHGGGHGIELGDLHIGMHLCGLDLDSCIKDGALAPWAANILQAVPSYAERSPSGNGIKLFYLAACEDVRPFLDRIGVEREAWGCRRSIPGEDARDHGPAVECYVNGRYFTVTGDQWPGSTDRLALLDSDQLGTLATLIPARKTPAIAGTGSTGTGDTSRSAAAFRKGLALYREGKTYEEMVSALHGDPETAEWAREKGAPAGGREFRRIWDKAKEKVPVRLDDFYAYLPRHQYIFAPTNTLWPAASVNATIAPLPLLNPDGSQKLSEKGKPEFIAAAAWLDKHRAVQEMTWAPGEPVEIDHRMPMPEGGWVQRVGAKTFNLYRPPVVDSGNPRDAQQWVDHVRLVYPNDAEHIIDFLAHRVQKPGEKINHALVLGGMQGIGKDSIFAPVRYAVGYWNCQEVNPTQIMGRFNGFLKSVILRVSEARDLGDSDRFTLYEAMKTYTAAPPDVLRVDEKNLREHPVMNCCGVVITTNHKSDGIYLPADDRRHYVAWSDLVKEDHRFANGYWKNLYAYYANGGNEAVAAYLAQRDLSQFDPKAPPPKTPAFWAIVDANRAPEEAELADILDVMERPSAFTLSKLISTAETQPGGCDGGFVDWLRERKNRRSIPHRLERCGYVPVRNPDADDGQWSIGGKERKTRKTVYAQKGLSLREQIAAAAELAQSVE